MKSSHRIVHSDRNCEDASACLSLLSESAFLNPAVILLFFGGFAEKICSFGVLAHESPIHTCMLVGRAACDTVLSLEFGESVLLSNTWLISNESWVPRSADKTFLNHSTVRGYN